MLLEAWPAAAAERDDDGNTPLHFAAACQVDSVGMQQFSSADRGEQPKHVA